MEFEFACGDSSSAFEGNAQENNWVKDYLPLDRVKEVHMINSDVVRGMYFYDGHDENADTIAYFYEDGFGDGEDYSDYVEESTLVLSGDERIVGVVGNNDAYDGVTGYW